MYYYIYGKYHIVNKNIGEKISDVCLYYIISAVALFEHIDIYLYSAP